MARETCVARVVLALALPVLGHGVAMGQEVLLEIDGAAVNEHLARSSTIDDLDGGGLRDLVVASSATPGGGLVRVYSSETGSILQQVTGDYDGMGLGWSIAVLGDFDGDSVSDYAAGAPNHNSANGQYAGAVRVYSGATGQLLAEILGPSTDFSLGMSVAAIGDVNGDGYADLIAGGFWGHVRVHTGPDGALLRTHPGPFTRPSVAGVGDVDRDLVPDYAVGWPQDPTNGCSTGSVTIYSGADGTLIHRVFGSSPCAPPGFTGDHLGLSVAGLGDVNGDGYPDFAAGAPRGLRSSFESGTGYARVYSGEDASILYEVTAENGELDGFGFRLASGADVNRDGVHDFIVGAPDDDGGDGPSGAWGSATVFCGRTGTMLWKVFGVNVFQPWGNAVSLLPDLDGDGHGEFAVGDALADFSFPGAGRVTIYKGAPGTADRYCPGAPSSTGSAATIDTFGPISVGENILQLRAAGLPPAQFGLFVYATGRTSTPFGDGTLCLGGSLFRIGDPRTSDASGVLLRPLSFTAPPANAGPGKIEPGATHYVQCWYRDPGGPGGSGFNLSDALAILFTP